MTTTRIQYSKCPLCFTGLDAATGVTVVGADDPGLPVEGDLTVCIHCGAFLRFGPGLVLYKASLQLLEDFARIDPKGFRVLTELKKCIDLLPRRKT